MYHLQTLGSRAEASVKEACREGGASSSTTTKPVGPIRLGSCATSHPVPHKSGGQKTGKKDERLGMYGQSAEKDGQVEVSSKTKGVGTPVLLSASAD